MNNPEPLKTLVLFLTVTALTGCTAVTYEGRFGRIERFGFGSDVTVGTLRVESDPKGAMVIEITNGSLLQSEALGAVVEGAVKGAIKGVAP